MLYVVLFEPEIPPNTGNVIRLCANTGTQLHLIQPLGFTLEDKQLRRAGLDYCEWASVQTHASLDAFLKRVQPGRVFVFSSRGQRLYTEAAFAPTDALLFGPETRGLPQAILDRLPPAQRLCLPMVPDHSLVSAACITLLYRCQNCLFQPRTAHTSEWSGSGVRGLAATGI